MRRTIFTFIVFTLLIISCTVENKSKFKLGDSINKDRFKSGYFETLATDDFPKTTLIRKGDLQIEIYESGIDTFKIEWLGLFKYKMRFLNPKNELEDQEYIMQIKSVKGHQYQFVGSMGKSKFEVSGTVIKVATLKDSLEFEKSMR